MALLLVSQHVAGAVEGVAAHVARVGPFSSVLALVDGQTRPLREAEAAYVTLERPLSCKTDITDITPRVYVGRLACQRACVWCGTVRFLFRLGAGEGGG